jgi:hypothetical protein
MSISDESIMDSSSEDERLPKRRRLTKMSEVHKAAAPPIVFDIDDSDDSDVVVRISKAHAARKPYCIDIDDDSSDADIVEITHPDGHASASIITGPFGAAVEKIDVHCIDIEDDSSDKSDCSSCDGGPWSVSALTAKLKSEEALSDDGDGDGSDEEARVGPFAATTSTSAAHLRSTATFSSGGGAPHSPPHLSSSSSESETERDGRNSGGGAGDAASPPGALQQLLAVNYRRKSALPKHPNLAYPATTSAIVAASLRPIAMSAAAAAGTTATTTATTGSTASTVTGPSSSSSAASCSLASVTAGTVGGGRPRSGSRSVVTEEPGLQQWRRCLWPGLAPFYRVILRARCVPDNKQSSPSGQKQDKADLHLEWGDFWDKSSLNRVGTEFDRS